MSITTRIAAALGVAAQLAASAATAAQTLRLNHNNPAEHPTGQSLEWFAKRVGELTDGEIRVRVFHNGQLGDQRTSTELVQQGALDMARSNAAELEAFEPLYSVINLPYLFTSEEHYFDALTGEPGRAVLDASADKGFIGLGYLVEGARSFYANKAITSPADLAGMKMRVQPSPSAIRMMELLGAQPTPIAWGELYSALQQGVVDGAENNPTALTSARHGEVAPHFSFDEHTMIPAVVFISTKAWEGLSPEHQEAMRAAGQEMMAFHRELWNAQSDEAIAQAKAEMGVEFHDVVKAPFIEAVQPMHEEVAAQSPAHAELIAQIKAMATN